jgi:hypothetical protein
MDFILISFCQALQKIGGDLCGKILWYVEIINKADVVYSLVYLIHPIPFFQYLDLNCSANNLSPLTNHPSFFIRESVKSPKLQVSRERNPQTNINQEKKKSLQVVPWTNEMDHHAMALLLEVSSNFNSAMFKTGNVPWTSQKMNS